MRRSIHSLLGLGLLLALVTTSLVVAGVRDQPAPLAGWTHPNAGHDDTPQFHGLRLSGGDVVRSSPVIAEIDGTPGNGKEVAFGGADGWLYIYHANGTLLRSIAVLPACAAAAGDGKLNSAPAVGKLYGDATPYIVVGYGTIGPSDCDGGVVAYNGVTGAEAWRFSLRSWQVSQGNPVEARYGVLSSPALADTDGNGTLEVGFGGFDRNVYLLDHTGTPRWYYHASDSVWSSPAFANVDADSALEMVIGTDLSANETVNPPTANGGYVYAFDTQPRTPLRQEFRAAGSFLWQRFFDQAIFSSPAIGNVLPASAGNEIVISSGCFFPASTTNMAAKTGRWVVILRPSDGEVLQTLTMPSCSAGSPALGDINEDGDNDVVMTVHTPGVPVDCHNASTITAWDPSNSADPLWSQKVVDSNSGCSDGYGGDIQSAVIADLDGNGSLEVVAANFWSLHVLAGKTGAPLSCQSNADTCKSLFAWKTLKSTPAIGQIDSDADLDLVIAGGHVLEPTTGMAYAWTNMAGQFNSAPGILPAYSAPWPMFRANAQHTGASIRTFSASSAQISAIQRPGTTRTYSLSFGLSDGAAFSWTATESDPSSILSLSPTSGNQGTVLVVTVTVPSSLGTRTASIQVTNSVGLAMTIPVTLKVVTQVTTTYLPLLRI